MQKAVKFLEAYVQWVALGLGLLWILWIGYGYWAKPPVVASINTSSGVKDVGPSEVDDVTREGPIATLQKALDNKLPIPPQVSEVLSKEGPQYLPDFRKKMSLAEVAVAPAQPMWPAMAGEVKDKGPTTGPTQDEKVGVPVIAKDVLTKPEPSSGLSVTWVPNPDKPAPAAGAPGAPPPNQIGFANAQQQANGAEPQKTFTPPGAGPEVIPVLMETKDTAWQTITARWNMAQLRDAFKKGGIPDAQAMTLFLRVRLVREEQQPDGSWGKPKYIDDLTNQAKLPWPPKTADEEGIYLDWAAKNQADIVEPPFFEVVRGTVWRTASMPDMGDVGDPAADAALAGGDNFDPANVKFSDVPNLTPDQKKKWYAWKAEQDKAERERRKAEADSRKAAQPKSGGAGGTGGGLRAPVPANDQRLSAPHGAPNTADGAGPIGPGRGGLPRENLGAAGGGAAQPAGTPTDRGEFRHGDIPQARFNPTAQGDLEIWGHDTTAVPGHTYRYKLEVSLLNPIYKTQNLAKNPADEAKFAITIDSDWTVPVSVATRQRFFASNGGNGALAGGVGGNMKFDYFWWEDGKWNMKTVTVQPGDALGKTGWTVVDFKPVGTGDRESRALLVNENGETVTRFHKTDQKDPEYAKLKALVAKSAAPPAGTPAPGSATGAIGQ